MFPQPTLNVHETSAPYWLSLRMTEWETLSARHFSEICAKVSLLYAAPLGLERAMGAKTRNRRGDGELAYSQICLQKRHGLRFGQGKFIGHFRASLRLAQVPVPNRQESNRVWCRRLDEAFKALHQGYGCGVHIRGPAVASAGSSAALDVCCAWTVPGHQKTSE